MLCGLNNFFTFEGLQCTFILRLTGSLSLSHHHDRTHCLQNWVKGPLTNWRRDARHARNSPAAGNGYGPGHCHSQLQTQDKSKAQEGVPAVFTPTCIYAQLCYTVTHCLRGARTVAESGLMQGNAQIGVADDKVRKQTVHMQDAFLQPLVAIPLSQV